jgi:hypothetical protein
MAAAMMAGAMTQQITMWMAEFRLAPTARRWACTRAP